MFDAIVDRSVVRKTWLRQLLIVSLAAHAVALAVVLIVDQLRVSPVPEPAITITFVDFTSPPPPPPPPPKKKAAVAPKKMMPPPPPVNEIVAPKEIPKTEAPTQVAASAGDENGVEGGVDSGIASAGKMAPAPTFQDVVEVLKNRITGEDPPYPASALAREIEGQVVVKITISPDGRVTDMQFIKSHPAFDRVVRQTVEGWKFTPHIVNGRAVSVYTVWTFTFKLS